MTEPGVATLAMIQGHSNWANRRLLDTAEPLTEDELAAPIGVGGYGDLLETLIHMYDAQESWYHRATRNTSGPALGRESFADLPALRAAWENLDAEMTAWLASLHDDDLDRQVSYRSYSGTENAFTIREMFLHQAFHSHQHRGEVALILSELGHSPGEIDFLDYLES